MKTESFQTDHPNPEIARLHRRANGWDLLAQGWRVLADTASGPALAKAFAGLASHAEGKRDWCLAEARKLEGE